MELTAETLLEVLRDLRSDAQTGQMRRRRLPRVGVRLSLVILPCGKSAASVEAAKAGPATVHLRNISRRGLGFTYGKPFAVNQDFIISLPRQTGGNVHLLGRVERCRRLDGGMAYDIGAAIRVDVPREEVEYHLARVRRCA